MLWHFPLALTVKQIEKEEDQIFYGPSESGDLYN